MIGIMLSFYFGWEFLEVLALLWFWFLYLKKEFWVKLNTPQDSIFLTAPIHNSFVSNLGGRRIYMGYPGLLWVHGISYGSRERNLKDIYMGVREAKFLVLKEGIDYIVVG